MAKHYQPIPFDPGTDPDLLASWHNLGYCLLCRVVHVVELLQGVKIA